MFQGARGEWLRRRVPVPALLAALTLLLLTVPRDLARRQRVEGPPPPPPPPIVLDPGHGGIDSGAFHGGVMEKDINLDIAIRVADLLAERGIPTVLTRNEDVALDTGSYREDLQRRIDVAVARGARALVAFHVNASDNPRAEGTVILFQENSREGRRLAGILRAALEGLEPGKPHVAGSEFDHYYFDRSPVPTVAVEIGYLTNDAEREALQREEYRARVAAALARALATWAAGSP